ncbi:MAG TPA: sulfite exporter TauE/SafE family protein [Candidatus Korarchaeota archaeon]|nr:sulfite exporter TauE/SafE family protein [Candidatus Korarchaeota archaeon]
MRFIEIILSGVGVGLLSSIAGIGGGTIMVPLMVLVLGIDVKVAIASSLLTIIVTSASSSSVYLKEGLVNLRVALTLEPTTALGAIVGASITIGLPSSVVRKVFGVGLMIISVIMLLRTFTKPREGGEVKNWLLGIASSFFAGVSSGMFGIGGGVLKVPIMNLVMGLPIKEAVATSSFMVGLTASSGSIVYALQKLVDPVLVLGFAMGIIPGATLGAKSLKGIKSKYIKLIFSMVLLYAGIKLLL